MIRSDLKLSHPELANGRWAEMSLAEQLGNIGSEISRAIKSKARGNTERMEHAATRAIELFELTIDCHLKEPAKLKELCRGKEEFCDYIFGDNNFNTDPAKMLKYYDQFALIARRMAISSPKS
ncbi:hypothetical protein IJG04_03470 [Candidatus Saccharibacteria bacterium]|nr:hypothetical protein [Candidatus Saccharibacteria bacterium]